MQLGILCLQRCKGGAPGGCARAILEDLLILCDVFFVRGSCCGIMDSSVTSDARGGKFVYSSFREGSWLG
jgi:hypothetical protein